MRNLASFYFSNNTPVVPEAGESEKDRERATARSRICFTLSSEAFVFICL